MRPNGQARPKDDNARAQTGTLPSDPEDDAEPWSEARAANDGGPAFRFLSPEELTAPIPPPTYALEALDMCAGRPAMLVGQGYVGKSIVAQSIGVAVAANRMLWGQFAVAHGTFVHLDYEMGSNVSRRRYVRLARGLGLDWARDVVPRVRYAPLPALKLNSPKVTDALKRACDGAVLAFVDSVRRSLPGEDENDSSITNHIDALTGVSIETGCTFVLVHHASTKGNNDGKAAARGTSAFFDAAGAVINMRSNGRGEPVKVTQWKAPERGSPCEDFYLSIEDVATDDGDTRGGLRVTYKTVAQVLHAEDAAPSRVLQHIRDNPGCTLYALRKAKVANGNASLDSTLEKLEADGRIENRPEPNRPDVYRWYGVE